MSNITVRFDQQVNAATRDVEHILTTRVGQVPSVGELINLAGNPYIVIRRGWAADKDEAQHAYVDVLPASATIGTPTELRQEKLRERDEADGDEESDLDFLHRLANRPSWSADKARLERIALMVQSIGRLERTPVGVVFEKAQSAELTPTERRLASTLLDMAADKFSNHGCNDFHFIKDGGVDDPVERRDITIAMEVRNGDEENLERISNQPPEVLVQHVVEKKEVEEAKEFYKSKNEEVEEMIKTFQK
jgi:hypothetical protein